MLVIPASCSCPRVLWLTTRQHQYQHQHHLRQPWERIVAFHRTAVSASVLLTCLRHGLRIVMGTRADLTSNAYPAISSMLSPTIVETILPTSLACVVSRAEDRLLGGSDRSVGASTTCVGMAFAISTLLKWMMWRDIGQANAFSIGDRFCATDEQGQQIEVVEKRIPLLAKLRII